MAERLRLYFLVFYVIGLMVLLIKVVPRSLGTRPAGKRLEDARRWLPAVLLPLDWLIPPAFILLRVGEIEMTWVGLRLFGFLLSLYAATMLLWAPLALGRFLVAEAVVLHDHALVSSGPYRFLRHPVYSGDLALFLGAALGTLNVSLLVLWPIAVMGTWLQARLEEQLLESKFGESYRRYARTTGRFLPRLWPSASSL